MSANIEDRERIQIIFSPKISSTTYADQTVALAPYEKTTIYTNGLISSSKYEFYATYIPGGAILLEVKAGKNVGGKSVQIKIKKINSF